MSKLTKIAKDFGFENVQELGEGTAKVWDEEPFLSDARRGKSGKLILLTAMTPNSFGVGKTTISIGLADALNSLGKRTILALREPSMGPVFGVKGGGTGGGASVLEPSEAIDLHFTGDFHAIAEANNLLSAIIDNHIFQGNELGIDQIFHKRCLDVNDRSLREISYEIRGKKFISGFNITAASEVMAVVALSKNLDDLKRRLGRILVGCTADGTPIYASSLRAENAMTKLLENAIKPNAVLSRGGTLALVHTGAFANIAHGASSVISMKNALSRADFCVTEAGFGSDLGGEKFVNITSRVLGKNVDVALLAVTVSGTKEHGSGVLEAGFENVKKHLQILREALGLRVVVAINRHADDQDCDVQALKKLCEVEGALACECQPFDKGGSGCVELAEAVAAACEGEGTMQRTYETGENIAQKLEKIAKKVYGAGRVVLSPLAEKKLEFARKNGLNPSFLNVAKTPLSISDNKHLLGAPKNFDFHVSDIEFRCGADMAVALAGDMLLMPGLGKHSRYLDM